MGAPVAAGPLGPNPAAPTGAARAAPTRRRRPAAAKLNVMAAVGDVGAQVIPGLQDMVRVGLPPRRADVVGGGTVQSRRLCASNPFLEDSC